NSTYTTVTITILNSIISTVIIQKTLPRGHMVAGGIVEEVTDFLTDTLSREDLKRLITEDGPWKAFVEAAELSSEDEAAIRGALEKHLAQESTEENDEPQKELQKKRFLEEFPELKRKLEEHIRKLQALADHLDQVHKGCTTSKVVSSSVSIVSRVLRLVLGPITGGASLLLSAASLGLGAAAAVTGLTTSIVKESITLSDEAEARWLVKASMDILNDIIAIVPKITVQLCDPHMGLLEVWKAFREDIEDIRRDRTIPCPTLPRIRGGRIRGPGLRGLMFGLDVYHLVTDSMDLYDGAKT
ncbi:hypothetical protein A6R68_23672, partial [Neotoma lepida]